MHSLSYDAKRDSACATKRLTLPPGICTLFYAGYAEYGKDIESWEIRSVCLMFQLYQSNIPAYIGMRRFECRCWHSARERRERESIVAMPGLDFSAIHNRQWSVSRRCKRGTRVKSQPAAMEWRRPVVIWFPRRNIARARNTLQCPGVLHARARELNARATSTHVDKHWGMPPVEFSETHEQNVIYAIEGRRRCKTR